MRLYSLGEIEWKDTQLIYHAMSYLGIEGVVICTTRHPYFCVGFHQGVQQELDLGRLESEKVPFFRRETGGGTVYLDQDQVFYQVIMKKDNPASPARVDSFSEKFLGPALKALEALGLRGEIVPPNDILVNRRKISGNGGGDFGDCRALIGDLLVDFDPVKMVNGLNCPTEGFRDACLRSMQENVTNVARELSESTPKAKAKVVDALVQSYQNICPDGLATYVPDAVLKKVKELEEKMIGHDWLFFPGMRRPGRRVKIRERVHIATLGVKQNEDEVIGWLQFGTDDGRLVGLEVIPKASDDKARSKEELSNKIVDLLHEDRFQNDMVRLLQDMGVPKEEAPDFLKATRSEVKAMIGLNKG